MGRLVTQLQLCSVPFQVQTKCRVSSARTTSTGIPVHSYFSSAIVFLGVVKRKFSFRFAQKCAYCHRFGATIMCRSKHKCNKMYHYPCASGGGCFQVKTVCSSPFIPTATFVVEIPLPNAKGCSLALTFFLVSQQASLVYSQYLFLVGHATKNHRALTH